MTSIWDIINIPLGWILKIGYELTHNYALALFFFAVVLQIILFPLGIKQQKNSVKQASLRPKEMAIRNKYAGRNDKVTQQKLNEEIMQLYQRENFNPMGGCLPMLIQLPILFSLYNVVMSPLKYVCGLSVDAITAIQAKVYELMSAANITGFEAYAEGKAVRQITRKLTYNPNPDAQNDMSMKIMNLSMPLLSVYISFTVAAAIGLYWVFRNILSVLQQLILVKMFPIPKFTEEDYKAAEREANMSKRQIKKSEKQKVRSLHRIDEDDDEAPAENKPAENKIEAPTEEPETKDKKPELKEGVNPDDAPKLK